MTDDAIVELEAGLLEAFAAARVATVENGHVIFLGNCINRVEQREEIFLGVDVFSRWAESRMYLPFSSPRRSCMSRSPRFLRF